jgi:hypothetical protein
MASAPAPPPEDDGPLPSAATAQHSVTLRFRVPFPTRWGENLVLCGDDDRLGAWEPARGSWMQCFHVGDVLVWQVCAGCHCSQQRRRRRRTEELRPPRLSTDSHTGPSPPPTQALVTVHGSSSFRYKYVVVDEHVRVPRPVARRGCTPLGRGWTLCPSTAHAVEQRLCHWVVMFASVAGGQTD